MDRRLQPVADHRHAARPARPKPVEYYDAWYHAAFALNKEGKAKEAKQTLASVMRLSPTSAAPR